MSGVRDFLDSVRFMVIPASTDYKGPERRSESRRLRDRDPKLKQSIDEFHARQRELMETTAMFLDPVVQAKILGKKDDSDGD